MGMTLPAFQRNDLDDFCKPLEGEFIGWRYLFLFPAGVAIIQLLFLGFVFRKENPEFYQHGVKTKMVAAYRTTLKEAVLTSSCINNSDSITTDLVDEDLVRQISPSVPPVYEPLDLKNHNTVSSTPEMDKFYNHDYAPSYLDKTGIKPNCPPEDTYANLWMPKNRKKLLVG